MALSRSEIADRLQRRCGFDPVTAKDFTDFFFEAMSISLERGEPVKLTGFGNFELRLKNPRPGRNPKTGEEVEISARRVVTYKASGKLLMRVQRS